MKSTEYKPIDCNLYDELVLLIMRKRKIELEYTNPQNKSQIIETTLTNVYTREGEEFITLINGENIRLDKIVKINGTSFEAYCRL